MNFLNYEDYERMYDYSINDPAAFWAEQAQRIVWIKPYTRVMSDSTHKWGRKWFVGGKLNVSANCLDRHLDTWRKNKAALIWQGEDRNNMKVYTYNELTNQVCRFANVLKKWGVKKGDTVAIYMPMIPELAISILACARIGAIHNVIFGGFSAESLQERINDSHAKVLITADAGLRRGTFVPLKENAHKALANCPQVESCFVVKHTASDIDFWTPRDKWWHHEIASPDISSYCTPEVMDSDDPLFILYTSGSTGKPKGILHSTAGYFVYAATTSKYVFDLKDTDTYWCTADSGWITGHSYVIYGPLTLGATTIMYEGLPNYPKPDRFWQIVEKFKVNILYTSPTAIRSLMREGEEYVNGHDLSSLRLLGSVGEPINPEVWKWYHQVVGKGKCEIVDTYWQTETGGIMISPIPGVTKSKPGSAGVPFFGVQPEILDENSKRQCEEGSLCFKQAWPGMMQSIHGAPDRLWETYFSAFPGYYFTGDGAKRDKDGYYWLQGRLDDVVNVSGHRLSTAEIESALVSHHSVAEAAAVGCPHEIKGQSVYVYVVLKIGVDPDEKLENELRQQVRRKIGAIAVPGTIQFAAQLPKTRSGKIMRRILKKIAVGETSDFGNVSTLAEPSVIYDLVESRKAQLNTMDTKVGNRMAV